jgi:hypothetical protein
VERELDVPESAEVTGELGDLDARVIRHREEGNRVRHLGSKCSITHLIRSGADPAQVSRFAGHSKVSTTLDLYVGEFEKRKVNDSGARLAAIYGSADRRDVRRARS